MDRWNDWWTHLSQSGHCSSEERPEPKSKALDSVVYVQTLSYGHEHCWVTVTALPLLRRRYRYRGCKVKRYYSAVESSAAVSDFLTALQMRWRLAGWRETPSVHAVPLRALSTRLRAEKILRRSFRTTSTSTTSRFSLDELVFSSKRKSITSGIPVV